MSTSAPTWPSIGGGRLPLRRVLVVQTQRLGDVLCATPVFTILRRQLPGAEITALVHRPHDIVLQGNPDLDTVLTYDRQTTHRSLAARLRFLWELRSRRFDWVLSIHAASSVAFAVTHAGIPWRTCVWRYGERRKPHWARGFQQQIRQDRATGSRHEIEHNLDVLRELGFSPEGESYRVVLSEAEWEEARGILRRHGWNGMSPLAVVHPGHGGGRQEWPTERYGAVARGLTRSGYQVVVTGSPGERELTAAVTAAANNAGVLDLGGQLSLRALAGVLGTAQLLVSIATGPMHLAAAMGTPAVTLYGPTDLAIDRTRFSTHHSPQRQVVSPVTCPCAGSHTCTEPVCMTAITPAMVLQAAEALR